MSLKAKEWVTRDFKFTLPEAHSETALAQLAHPSPRTVYMELILLEKVCKIDLNWLRRYAEQQYLAHPFHHLNGHLWRSAPPEDSTTRSAQRRGSLRG